MEHSASTAEIAVDDTHVYWTENSGDAGKVFRTLRSGGPREAVASVSGGPVRDLQVDGSGRAYYLSDVSVLGICCGDLLHQVQEDGAGSFEVVYSAVGFIDGYTVDADEVVVASHKLPDMALKVEIAAAGAIGDATAWTELYDAGSVGTPRITELALFENSLFWHEDRESADSSLLRIPRSGGSAVAITAPRAEVRDLRVAGSASQMYVYWVEHAKIYRLPVGAGPLSRDLVGDEIDLEVTQSIQDSGHTVPLVEDKRTSVRVYSRLGNSSDGATRLDLHPSVWLEGRRVGSVEPFPESPLRPLDPNQSLLTGSVSRDSTDHQFGDRRSA